MRPGIDSEWLALLAASGITTFLLARLDFFSETIFVWTGNHSLQVTGSGDTLLDGNNFEPFAQGVVIQVGDNTFNTSGSEAMEIVLSVPASIPLVMQEASLSSAEYLTRPATIWRIVMKAAPTPGVAPQWAFKRIRAGRMDNLEIQHDQNGATFKLTIEAYAAAATAATGRGYIDQNVLDATDTSQTWASSAANGEPGKHVTTPSFRQRLAETVKTRST